MGRVTVKHIYEIAKVKLADVHKADRTDVTLRMMCRRIVGSARSMGIEVYNPYETQRSRDDPPIPEALVSKY